MFKRIAGWWKDEPFLAWGWDESVVCIVLILIIVLVIWPLF